MLFRLWLSFQRQSSQCVFCSLVALNLRGQTGASSQSEPQSPSSRVCAGGGGCPVCCETVEGMLAACPVDGSGLPGGLVEVQPTWACEGPLAPGSVPSGSWDLCRPGQEPGPDVCFEVWLLGAGRALGTFWVTAPPLPTVSPRGNAWAGQVC